MLHECLMFNVPKHFQAIIHFHYGEWKPRIEIDFLHLCNFMYVTDTDANCSSMHEGIQPQWGLKYIYLIYEE